MALAGVGLVFTGPVLQRVDVMVLGLAALVAVMAGLLIGLRFRLSNLSSEVEHRLAELRSLMLRELAGVKTTAAENNGLVLRAFRDLQTFHGRLADMVGTKQTCDSLPARLDGLSGSPAELAIDLLALREVIELVMAHEPGLVVECGGGASTICMANALRQLEGARLVSLEHLADRAAATGAMLAACALRGTAAIRLISDVEVLPEDISVLVLKEPVDSTGRLGSYPVRALLERLRPGALLLIHTAGYENAEQVMERWRRECNGLGNMRMTNAGIIVADYLPDSWSDVSFIG